MEIEYTFNEKTIVFPLYYSIDAQRELVSLCGGDLSKLPEWLNADGKDIAAKFDKIIEILGILINGGIKKHNLSIVLGLSNEQKKEPIDKNILSTIYSPFDIKKIEPAIFSAMSNGLDFDVPAQFDNAEKKDPDLEEYKATKKGNFPQSGKLN